MKKIFGTMAVVAAILFAGHSANKVQNEAKLTILGLANIEALASNESDTSREDCVPDGVECSMVIIYSDGYSGVETIYGKKKAPGWI